MLYLEHPLLKLSTQRKNHCWLKPVALTGVVCNVLRTEKYFPRKLLIKMLLESCWIQTTGKRQSRQYG